MKKRILSILLALCMVLCLVPITAFAATQTVDSWSGLQNLINSTNNLSVTLSSDISWGGSSLTVPVGKTVTLDLNGKAIDAQSNGTVIVVNGTLTIKNSGADLAGPIGAGAGPITGNIKNGKAVDQEAGGILVASGGKLIMNSGWLTNCVDGSGKISAAGGIYVSKNAAFEMTGGIITGCIGSDLLCAAGVVNYGTFTMSGNATISGSKTKYNSDGVAICNAGTLNANGGTVQTGQKCTNYATIQNTGKNATVFYCNVSNTGLGTITGGTYSYPVENSGTIAGGTFNGTVTSNGTINDGTFNGTVDNTRVVTGGTFNGTTSGIYTVTFDSGAPSQIRANYPATAPDAPTKRGYTFNGWLNGGTPYDFTQNVTQNLSLTADWAAKSYTVRFDTNGGTTIADKTLCWDDKVLDGVSNPTKPGYDFMGWTFGGGNVLTRTTYANLADNDTVTSITLTAQWAISRYTVTFDYNDGKGTKSTTTITYGEEFDEMPVPVRETYVFGGWYDAMVGGKCYGDENGKSASRYDKTENCTLYAQWMQIPCTVTFDANGGTMTGPDTDTSWKNTTISEPEDPVRTGYSFNGWYKDAACTQAWNFADWLTGDMTLYAGWTVNQYTITFDTAGGSEIASITQDYGTAIIAPADPTREGYTFTGWDKAIPTTMPAENVIIKAQWKINQYTITFDTAGGSEIAPISQDYGTAIIAPANPTREGYTFTGWDKAIPATMPAENMTITAQWKDTEKPTGEIKIGENSWKTFLNNITFGLFFKDTQTVTINASDNGSGIKTVEYLLSAKELTETELASAAFTAYTAPFGINPDNEYIVYVRLTDTAGNVSYICSEGIVLDATNPVIKGIENGKTYCAAQTVTITEKYVDTVTVNGTAVTLDENNSFVLSPADGEQKIVVTDKAGNTAEMTVTVNDGHTFGRWSSNGDATHTRKCTVDGCTGTETNNCADGDKNHKCDVCDATLSEHTDADKNHICDYCNGTISNHVDTDKNHICDLCEKTISNHTDVDKDHKCDYCGKVISNHEDTDKNHVCDYCGKVISNHEDTDNNHVCDYCGKVITNHEDTDSNHVCDYCGKVISNHEDTDNNHVCDYCGKVITNHEDTDKDHVCDYCGKTISNHEDADKDHVCDYCGKTISNHEDTDKNHVCDYCGKTISNHTGGKATCKDKSVCEICEKAYGEIDAKNHADIKHIDAKAATKDAEGNIEYWYCEGCGKHYSDAAATKEITKAETITAKLKENSQKDPAKTGNSTNLMLWIALLFVSGGALIGVIVVSKKKKRSIR